MRRTKREAEQAGANYGIVGNVQAKALAVGDRAQASVTETHTQGGNRAEIDAALQRLECEIRRLNLPPHGVEALSQDVEKLKDMSRQEPASGAGKSAMGIIEGFTSKLKAVGVLVETATSLREPLLTIARWLGVPLSF